MNPATKDLLRELARHLKGMAEAFVVWVGKQ